jgi:sugar/nucleoside kinase (ribokinase family)
MPDVYAYGVVAPSTLIELRDGFPPPGGYAEIAAVHPSLGGEAAGTAYTLARLGASTKLQGNRLGGDDASARVLALLSRAGVDCSALAVDAGAQGITEVVIAHGAERTILATYAQLLEERSWEAPSRDDVAASRVVSVDPFFGAESQAAAQWSHEFDIPYVTVDAPPDSPIVQRAHVAIISEEFASRTFGAFDARDLLAAYTGRCRGLVIITRGGRELWYGRNSAEPVTWTPFPASVRDTTGAGDSFRAGVIYAMLQEQEDHALVRTASAVAALVCERAPGVLNSPTRGELASFLGSGGSHRTPFEP